jgi:hypothetical protein
VYDDVKEQLKEITPAAIVNGTNILFLHPVLSDTIPITIEDIAKARVLIAVNDENCNGERLKVFIKTSEVKLTVSLSRKINPQFKKNIIDIIKP